jgi:hypothetical protein
VSQLYGTEPADRAEGQGIAHAGYLGSIEQQNQLLRAMRAAPPGSPPEDSMGDIIQKAANVITVKDYPRAYA